MEQILSLCGNKRAGWKEKYITSARWHFSRRKMYKTKLILILMTKINKSDSYVKQYDVYIFVAR
jgi:hypothetical protein